MLCWNFFINMKMGKRFIAKNFLRIFFSAFLFLPILCCVVSGTGSTSNIMLKHRPVSNSFHRVSLKILFERNTLEMFIEKLKQQKKKYEEWEIIRLPHKSVSNFQAKSLLLAFPLCIYTLLCYVRRCLVTEQCSFS